MEPLDQRAGIAATLLWVTIIVTLFSIYSNWNAIQYLTDVQAGNVDYRRGVSIDSSREYASWGRWLVFVATAVAFPMWFHRAHKNLVGAGLSGMNHTPALAAGSFFIPVANFYYPYSAMKELSMGSMHLEERSKGEGPSAHLAMDDGMDETVGDSGWLDIVPDSRVGLWWGLWMASIFIIFFLARSRGFEVDPQALIDRLWASIFGGLISIPAAFFAIRLVRTITAQQEAVREHQQNMMVA